MGGSCGGLRQCSSVSEGSCGRERRTVGSVRRESAARTGCTGTAGAGTGTDTAWKAAGDEISIACGELLGYDVSMRFRVPQSPGCGARIPAEGDTVNGSSVSTSRVVVVMRGRGGPRPGLSSDEMDMDEPNEWSSSFNSGASRATGDESSCASSMPHAAGTMCGEESMAAM